MPLFNLHEQVLWILVWAPIDMTLIAQFVDEIDSLRASVGCDHLCVTTALFKGRV